MSTLEHKVEVITEWLQRQAAARRLTNVLEVQTWAGLRLAEKGYRSHGSSLPISRESAWEALGVIAQDSYAKDGAMLPALVVHFEDKKPGHRFAEWAIAAGLMQTPQDAEQFIDENGERRLPLTQEVLDLHVAQVDAMWNTYGAAVPDDASSLT